MDPWIITPPERERHTQQFMSLKPEAGFISGGQAKNFLMQSGLPPMVLAQVWGLADINGDGRMDFMEFSIACKLITNKLKGFEVPAQLPTQMLQAPPSSLPVSGIMPGAPRHAQPGMQGMGMPGMMGGQPRMPGMMPGMMGMPGHMPASMGGPMPGMVPNSMMGMVSMPGQMSMAGGMPGQMSMAGGVPASMGGMAPGHHPGMQQYPGQHPGMQQQVPIPGVQPSVMPIVSNPAMVAPAPPAVAEIPWTIPQASRVKSSQIFQANDRARTGFLAAVQARSLLLQTGLAQQTLAGVWNLSDIDKDGKLSCEEFILAMYLCEVAMKGEPLPPALPINLIPPSLRKYAPQAQAGSGTPGSVHSGVNEDMSSPASFEDRRKENWEAGQAELDKRRASLLEQQKKDEEDRKRKEKEEAEKREKQKQEVERRRQAELEKAAARAREVQEQQEEQKRRMEQQREQARVEMERQRLLEWERQRTAELEQHRQRETEKVITLRAKRETVNKELEDLKGKIKYLSDGITETRTGVTDVKSFIDGMRTARDTKMSELNSTKTRLKEQNVRLLQVSQEKSKLEAKNKINAAKMEEGRVVELTDFDLKKSEKQELLEKLREKLSTTKVEEQQKKEKFEEDKKVLMEHRDKLRLMIETCKELHKGFDEKRLEVKAEKAKQIRELTDPNHAWGGSFEDESFSPVQTPAAVVAPPMIPPAPSAASVENSTIGYVQYRALYDYEQRNDDELSFACGDIILVHPGQEHEPGWLGGELNGQVGWFPEAYAEKAGENGVDQTLHPIAEVPENGSDSSSLQDPAMVGGKLEGEAVPDSAPAVEHVAKVAPVIPPAPVIPAAPTTESDKYIVLYEYRSEEPGDLNLDAGEVVVVTQKDGDWWTGQLGDRVGVFPFNYVEPAPAEGAEAAWGSDANNDPAWGSAAINGSGDPANGEIHPAPAADPAVGWADPAVGWADPDIQTDINEGSGSESDKSGKKLEIATVIAPYEATSKEQLSLAKGQMILIRKKTDTGWWQGELQAGGKGKKRAVGWFPASYVQVKGGGGDDKKESPVASEPAAITDAAQGSEKVVALFAYSGQYEDELSFEAGEEITIVAKDEEAWWRGEIDGRTGVFPSNYVEPVQKLLLTQDEKKRENLVKEIFSTEENYLENLKIVSEVFVKPIRSSGLLSREEMSILFINWKDLIHTNNKLLKCLRIRLRNSHSPSSGAIIGDILCENFSAMTAYIRFCSSQLSAAALLQKLVETRPEFDSLIRQCQSHAKVQGMPLSFYLLKPVKRITEYPLLVEKLLKNTNESHPDFSHLEEALARSRTVCDQVNEGMREKENSERLEWLQIHVDVHTEEKALQEKITFNSTTNSVGPRRFLHCGVLRKTKSEKELVVFLFNDFLLFTTANKSLGDVQFSFDKHHNMKLKLYREPLFLSGLSVGPSLRKSGDTEDTVGFSLISGDMVIGLDALSINDKTMWSSKVTKAIQQFAETEKVFLTREKSVKESEKECATGRLLVIIVKGEGFAKLESVGNIDAYCEATMGSQEEKTAVASGVNPHWNASMQFMVKDLEQDILCLTVFDRDFFSPNEFLGRTEVKIKDVYLECQERRSPVSRTLKLQEAESGVISIKVDIQMFNQ